MNHDDDAVAEVMEAVNLAVNAWVTATTVARSDVLSLCDAPGINHKLFAKALHDGPLAMRHAQQKATAMDEHAYAAGFAIELARKGLALAANAAAPTRYCAPSSSD